MKEKIKVRVENTFHNTSTYVMATVENAKAGLVSITTEQAKTLKRKLCGIKACACSGPLGCYGHNSEILSSPEKKGGWFFFYVTSAARIRMAEDVEDLAFIINSIDAEDVDGSSLPTFGGRAPADTDGIYSWDAWDFLVTDSNGKFVVKPR